jgi:hypothetical protein
VSDYTFEAALDIPHNSVDPAADEGRKQLAYQKILQLPEEGG